jgi:hypothetical protein
MREIVVFFGLACFLGSVTGCGAMNALFNSKLEKDSLLHQITLDHPTDAAKMNKACRNAVPEVSSDLQILSESSDVIAFSTTGFKEFYFGTGEEYRLVIRCTLLPSKKHILISADEQGLPGSLKLVKIKDKFEQMVVRVQTEVRLNSGGPR